jgi:hypothetical protein
MVNDLEPYVNGDDHVGDESQPPTPPPKDGSFEPRLPGMLFSPSAVFDRIVLIRFSYPAVYRENQGIN